MPLISIIIPVYKVEHCLRRCLDSVLSQTFTDYECILIDGASPDNSPAICNEYVAKDSRFKVIHKEQRDGLPMARKTGLDFAVSDFIFHLDADDWIEPDALELLYLKQKETNAEIVIGNFREICLWGTNDKIFSPTNNFENPIEWLLLCDHKFLWGKLYKKMLYKDYIIPMTPVLEDGIVNIQLFSKLTFSQIQFIDKIIYNYDVKMNNGLTTQLQSEKYDSYNEHPIINACIYIYTLLGNSLKKNNRIYSAYLYLFLYVAVAYYFKRSIKIKKNEIQNLYVNYYKKCSHLHIMRIDYRLFLPICNFSPFLGKMYIYIRSAALKIRYLIYQKANY